MNKFKKFLQIKFGKWNIFPYRWSMYYYNNIRTIFSSKNKKIRAFVLREWVDITSLIVDVNFAMIKQFYEDEYLLGTIDWEKSSDTHKQFEQWLKEAYTYVSYKRPTLEAERDSSYPFFTNSFSEMFELSEDSDGKKRYTLKNDGIPYEIKYNNLIKIEKEITDKDTEILKQMIDYREYFWT